MENGGINDKGDDVESLSDRNNNDESTHSGDSLYDILNRIWKQLLLVIQCG